MNILEIRDLLLNQGKTIYDLPLRVTSYSRVSTGLEAQETSLYHQKNYYKNLITNNSNWTHVDGYADEGITGTSTIHRDSFNRMVEDGLNGKFDLILTKEVSRFARNTLDSIYYTRELLKNNVAVYFENDSINTFYPDSEFKLTMIASIAQEDSRKTSQRVKWGKQRALEEGHIFIPSNMHGYKLTGRKVEIIEEEAIFIKRIFELYCQGVGFRRIGLILEKEGYVNANGNPYNYSTLRKILTNPRYKGYFTGGLTETVDYLTGKVIHKDPDEWVVYPAPDIIPPIVSEDVWNKANELLRIKRKKVYLKHETSYTNKYKYSGKIYCKEHNTAFHRALYRYKNIPNKEVYQCKVYRTKGLKGCNMPTLYTDELDTIMAEIFKKIFEHKEDFIDELLEMIKNHLQKNDFTQDIKKIIKDIEKVSQKKNKLLDLILNELISKKEFKDRNDEFNLQIKLLEKELERYEEIKKATKNTGEQLKLMKKFLNKEYNFEKNVPEELIDIFVDKIWVDKGEYKSSYILEIDLKTGQKIPAYYFKDIILSLTTHIEGDKMIHKFPRIKNAKDVEPLTLKVKNINLKIVV